MTSVPSADVRTPPATESPSPLRRRFAAMLYEAMLLFAVVFVGDYLFDTLTQSRHALMFRHGRQAWLFVIVGAYFVWFWVHGGQTLAMKTWHIRVVAGRGAALTYGRAIARYLLLWIFVVPTLAAVWLAGLGGWAAVAALAAALVLPPCYALVDRDRQFIHDRLLGTRVVAA